MPIVAAFVVPHPPLILPQVGRGEEKTIERTIDAYRRAMAQAVACKPDTVVIASPHAEMYADYFHLSPGERARGDMRRFGAGDVVAEVAYDAELTDEIARNARQVGIPAGKRGERERALDHGTMIPLCFLQALTQDFKLVRVGLSGLSPDVHYALGKCIAQAASQLDRRVVFIASGDLSHKLKPDGPYGFAPEGPVFDEGVCDALAAGDFGALLSMPPDLCEAAAECGLRAFWMMAGALDQKAVAPELLSYEGPFGVGYGVAAFSVVGDDPARQFDQAYLREESEKLKARKAKEDAYVRLARLSVETVVTAREHAPLPEGLPEEMRNRRAGVFVSLKKHGQLRGCIGTISPTTDCVASEILRNAVCAACEDPRFDPVKPDELPFLSYSVDVLSPPEEIASPRQLDVKRYGVIVQCGRRRGLLLPNLDGIDTVEEQIAIARQKGGIDPRENALLFRFEVVRHT